MKRKIPKSNAPEVNREHHLNHLNNSDLIIANKTYSVKELGCIFDYNVLMLIDDKKTLLDYYYMAVETGIKRFISIVDSVIERKFTDEL